MSVKTDNFINRIAPMAVRDMQNTRVLASLTIAQAIWKVVGERVD